MKTPRVALVHDHLAQDGGAEKVLMQFSEIWPDAPIYVAVHDPQNAHPYFSDKDVRPSFLQHMPFGVKKYQWYFPLMPTAVESWDFSEYDIILSTSSSFAKGIITRPETMHTCYLHTPTRFLWSDTHSYVNELGVNRFVKKLLPPFLTYVRMWDRQAAERVDNFIVNSETIKRRTQKYYSQEGTVIYPPVSAQRFTIAKKEEIGDFYLAGGRLVPYKRFDLLIEAFERLGKKLVIYGDGPVKGELQKMAGKNVEFVGRVSDEELQRLYRTCAAFLNPQEEDFGITMLEAMASGRPVIAYNKGGATEIVNETTGVLVDYQTWEDFADTVISFDPMAYDGNAIRDYALTFDDEQFKKRIHETVLQQWEAFNS